MGWYVVCVYVDRSVVLNQPLTLTITRTHTLKTHSVARQQKVYRWEQHRIQVNGGMIGTYVGACVVCSLVFVQFIALIICSHILSLTLAHFLIHISTHTHTHTVRRWVRTPTLAVKLGGHGYKYEGVAREVREEKRKVRGGSVVLGAVCCSVV
jgi:hypothetical protein